MTMELFKLILATILVVMLVFFFGFSVGDHLAKKKEKVTKAFLRVNHNDPTKDLFLLDLQTDLDEIEEDGYLLAMVVEE